MSAADTDLSNYVAFRPVCALGEICDVCLSVVVGLKLLCFSLPRALKEACRPEATLQLPLKSQELKTTGTLHI